MNQPTQPSLPPGWNRAEPEHLPKPTQWPAALSLAVTLIFWGLIGSLVVTGIGIALFACAITGWISDIRHERREQGH